MKIRKHLSILFSGLILCGFLVVASPVTAQVQEGDYGCCQFSGKDSGCWYPSGADACTKLEGTFVKDAKCNAEATKCVTEEEASGSESEE